MTDEDLDLLATLAAPEGQRAPTDPQRCAAFGAIAATTRTELRRAGDRDARVLIALALDGAP